MIVHCISIWSDKQHQDIYKDNKTIVSLARNQEIRLIIYLNNFLVMAYSRSKVIRQTKLIFQKLKIFKFKINIKKFNLKLSKQIKFLDFKIDSIKIILSLLKRKINKIKN